MPTLKYSCKQLGIDDGINTPDCTPRMGSYKSPGFLADMLIKYHIKTAHPKFAATFASDAELKKSLINAINAINTPKYEEVLKTTSKLWKDENITTLDLKRGKLKELPENLAKLKKLKVLDISFNEFKQFPEVVCGLPALEELYFGGDFGIRSRVKSLPADFTNLKNLRELDLSYNMLPELPTVLTGLIKLEWLNLQGNDIKSLNGIGELVNLEVLNIAYNQLTALPDEITKLQNLTELNLSCKSSPKFKNKNLELKKLQTLPNLKSLALINWGFESPAEEGKIIGSLKGIKIKF